MTVSEAVRLHLVHVTGFSGEEIPAVIITCSGAESIKTMWHLQSCSVHTEMVYSETPEQGLELIPLKG